MSYKSLDTLYKRSFDAFDEMINDVLIDSQKNDQEYKRLNDINKNLRRKYQKLMMIYESENPQKLNQNEIDALITILNNEVQMRYIIYEKMFILGNKEAYYYFKRMGIIKEEDKK